MVAKVLLVIVLVGAGLSFVGVWLGETAEPTPEEAVGRILHPQSDPVVSRGTLGKVAYWAGVGLVIAGGLGLLFCGVRKSFLTDGACHP